jgi:hypothetical protein
VLPEEAAAAQPRMVCRRPDEGPEQAVGEGKEQQIVDEAGEELRGWPPTRRVRPVVEVVGAGAAPSAPAEYSRRWAGAESAQGFWVARRWGRAWAERGWVRAAGGAARTGAPPPVSRLETPFRRAQSRPPRGQKPRLSRRPGLFRAPFFLWQLSAVAVLEPHSSRGCPLDFPCP